MAIRGSLSEASIADVVQLLAIGRKTGCLAVAGRNSLGRIYFDEGIIAHASILNRNDRLGDMLVRSRRLDPIELASALAEQNGSEGPRLGETLVRRGLVSAEEIERMIRIQIEEAVYTLFTWTRGSFHFEPDELPHPSDIRVALNAENVLLEGARRVDEWALIEKRIPSSEMVFSLDRTHGDPEATSLTDEQRGIIPLLDGSRSVTDIAGEAGLSDFEATKALFGLVQAGYARHEGRKRDPRLDVDVTSLATRRALANALYRARMLTEAEQEFERLAKDDPDDGDARFRLACVHLRLGKHRRAARGLMKSIELSGGWAGGYQNLALALEAQGRLADALLAVEEGLHLEPENRPLLLSRAILLTRVSDVSAACTAFEKFEAPTAGGTSKPASYYAYSIVALAAVGRLEEAKSRADSGRLSYPRHSAIAVNAAAVAEHLGESAGAERLYRRALELDPNLPQAQRGLAEILVRRGRYEDAHGLLGQLSASGHAGPEVGFLLGQVAYRLGDRGAALDQWKATLELDPDHHAARTHLELLEASGPPIDP
ncbi:MAG: DUF4388 domain-containing protein [Gemmatimonas sp.]|nr:DUF4388 domain-containing protein [Gemmatimonas sp.]